MKILEVTAFSSGFCGLWARVKKEAELLAEKNNEVHVFSSNIHRGSEKIEFAPEFENNKIKIRRFKTKTRIGQNTFFWDYTKEALKLKPDVIICHAYRQYYSTIALKIAKKLNIPCILVTHAPFVDKKIRGWKLNLIAELYDSLIGKKILKKYSKIFTITKWETPILLKLGAKKSQLIYIPNGIPEEFFKTKKQKKTSKQSQILFLGRIAPVKNLETLIKAFKICSKNKNLILNLVGPSEKDYENKLKNLIKELNLEKQIIFSGPVHDLKEKIKIIDNSEIFVLPSIREGMPQSLIEAMAREKIVISSNIQAGKEIIQDNENGFLFETGNQKQLSEILEKALRKSSENSQIQKQARKSVEQFSWEKLINKISKIIEHEIQI